MCERRGGGWEREQTGRNENRLRTLSLIFVRFRALVHALMREVVFKYAVPGKERLQMKLSNAKYILSSRVNA